ncbi:MAG: DUF6431 domain-containing protein [Bryobacteraceae bacterium]
MIVVIPRTDPEATPSRTKSTGNGFHGHCPACREAAIIGHGRRWKQAHDERHDWIRVRRGFCKHCETTCTVLPAWSLPYSHYSVFTRQQSCEQFCDGAPLERTAPTLQDPDRIPDGSTLRRWFERRLESLLCWLYLARQAPIFRAPTILAWDWRAALRILIPEPRPG